MDKKIFTLGLLVFLFSVPFIFSSLPPQFLIFQGDVIIDGRIVNEGIIVNFSIDGIELNSSLVDDESKYGPIFIQGFSEFVGEPINITIGSHEAEQKIDYVSPQDIFLNLSALTEKALKITESFPDGNTIEIQKTGTQTFSILTETGYGDIVNHTWFLDGESVLNITNTSESSFAHEIMNSDKGIHEIIVSVTDGFLTVFKKWTLIIERPEIENFDGDTTDLDSLDLDELENVPNVVLEKTGKGKIEFLANLNLSGVTDLNNKIKIEKGVVAIDSSFYPQLNRPAIITLSGLNYNTIPEIFFTNGFTTNPNSINQKCDFCNILNFTPNPTTNGEVVFEVDHFSSFKVGESGNKHNLSLFDDLDTCKSGIVGDLVLKIKDPDGGDDFEVGEEIEVEIEVENNADENKRIVVEISLYNIDEDDEIENTDDDKKIKDNDEEKFDLTLNVPDDFENDDYLVFVKAYEKGNEKSQCIEGAVEIDLEREKHDVVIKDFSLNPREVLVGNSLNIDIEIENIGESDEDVYIVLEIKELGIIMESETFEIEEFGDDDFFSGSFFIEIPNDTKKGEYELEIKVVFDDGEDVEKEIISVLEKSPFVGETIFLNEKIVEISAKEPLKIEKKEYIILEKKPLEMEKKEGKAVIPLFVPWMLFVGIVVLVILVVFMSLRRR